MLRRRLAPALARSLVLVTLAQTGLACQSKDRAPATSGKATHAEPTAEGQPAPAKVEQPAPPPPAAPIATPTATTAEKAAAGSGSVTRADVALDGRRMAPTQGQVAMAKPRLAGPTRLVDQDKVGGEGYKDYGHNAWIDATKDHLSTFAADVDTASYTIARRKLTEGALPPAAAVRVEEFVNYFHYGYAAPPAGQAFGVHVDGAPSPFEKGRWIVRVGVDTKAKSLAERKPMRLTFLVDVSGSMQSPDKLELAKRSLRILVDNLKDGDTVALVTYAGATRVVLPATGLERKNEILSAIEDLTAGGSTAMASGLELAYEQAMKGLGSGVESRVIVLSDGDANVGASSHDQILATIAGKVKEGVTLSTIGFGMGNYKDETMEQLANKGNGNNFYIDGLSQAKRVFQQQLGSTLEVVAQDVKLQVDFDPTLVSRYRLVGYENRDVADTDFRNDAVDAGEIGAGHQVTAVYEVELRDTITADKTPDSTLLTVRVRHKEPKGTKASERATPFAVSGLSGSFATAPEDLRFAFAVAAFADVLRGGEDAEHWDLAKLQTIASQAAGDDADRKELVDLIGRARDLRTGVKTAAAIAR